MYFSTNDDVDDVDKAVRSGKESLGKGRFHFAKFETSKINDCLEFIRTKQLHLGGMCALACFS